MTDKKCPFLEEKTVAFCKEYSMKMIPTDKIHTPNRCTEESYTDCPIYGVIAEAGDGERVRGFALKKDFYYHLSHSWLRREGENFRIGLDDFAQRLVGKIKEVKLPLIGSQVQVWDFAWELRCGNKTAKMVSPINGTVVDVNEEVLIDPTLLNRDSYGQGWLFIARPSDDTKLSRFFFGKTARNWLEGEVDKLHQILETDIGVIITDGGDLVGELYAKLDKNQWLRLIRSFLLTSQ